MKFEYTDFSEVDSSLAEAVYYNSETREMALECWNRSTLIYTDVPYGVFSQLINSRSVGSTYNVSVKGQYTNKYGGAVTLVEFEDVSDLVPEQEEKKGNERKFIVRAVVPLDAEVTAGSLDEAVAYFMKQHRDIDGIQIKEVVVPFGE
jgi:hypothetical protein